MCGLVGRDTCWSDKWLTMSQRNVVPLHYSVYFHLNSIVLFYSHSLYRPASRSVKRTRKLSLCSIKYYAQKVVVNVGHTCLQTRVGSIKYYAQKVAVNVGHTCLQIYPRHYAKLNDTLYAPAT